MQSSRSSTHKQKDCREEARQGKGKLFANELMLPGFSYFR
jgi:hypothetical protein